MKGIDYHGCLEEMGRACNAAQADIFFIRNPLQGFRIKRLPDNNSLARVLWKSGIFLRHLGLVGKLWMSARHRMILIREFSSIPMLVISVFVLPLRKKLILTVNHNLQWAVRDRREGLAFRMLDRLGFRFLFFETLALDGCSKLGLDTVRHWVAPLPVAACSYSDDASITSSPLTVGIVGHYRPEKGIDDVLDVLLADKPAYRLILGIPNTESFIEGSRYGKGNSGFELKDTSKHEAYFATLKECDIVLLCYTADGYRYRPSGIVADAAACGAAILAPYFPVLEHQIQFPAVIGECYTDLQEIPGCIGRMAENRGDFQDAFALYKQGRAASSLARLFDELVAGVIS